MTLNMLNNSNRLNNVYSERIRIVRETNERAVKNKKGLLRAVFKAKESHAPSAAYWYGTSAGGGYKRVTHRVRRIYTERVQEGGTKESRTECGVLVRNECICHVPCVAYGGKQKNVHGGTKAVRGENKRTYTGVQL